MRDKLWDRIPTDIWRPINGSAIAFTLLVTIAFGSSFVLGWNFYFPSTGEQFMWRICSVYNFVYSMFILSYHVLMSVRHYKHHSRLPVKPEASDRPLTMINTVDIEAVTSRTQAEGKKRRFKSLSLAISNLGSRFLHELRTLNPDNSQDEALPLRITFPVWIATVLYILCRLYFYLEDMISLRSQPSGVYVGVNKFLPFTIV
jgi:hypothetical protein